VRYLVVYFIYGQHQHKCYRRFQGRRMLPVNETKIIRKKVSVQIVQEKLFDVIRIKHCSLTKLSLISYCGIFSYSSVVKNGLSKRVIPITRQQYDELHHFPTINYNSFLITEFSLNDTKLV